MHFLRCFFFLCCFCFCFVLFCFFIPFSEQWTCQIWIGHNFVQYEIWNLSFGWTRYKTEHRVEEVCCSKCFIVSIMSFHVYFVKQVHKKLKKKTIKQTKKKIKAWILLNQTCTQKQTRAAALRHTFFFSRTKLSTVICKWSYSSFDHIDWMVIVNF